MISYLLQKNKTKKQKKVDAGDLHVDIKFLLIASENFSPSFLMEKGEASCFSFLSK